MKYFSMFSGIGGFEYGIEQSEGEWECVGYSEIDKYAAGIYQLHYPNHRNYGDATQIKTEELPDFDLLVGGFPCQPFSVAGKRRGFDDTRGTLFYEISRVLQDKRPRYFLLENVRGLIYHNKGKTVQKILEILSTMDYWVELRVLNSKDFGVPQNRERMFIIGHLRGECKRKILSISRATIKDNQTINSNKCGIIIRNKEIREKDISSCLDANYYKGFDNYGQRTGVMIKEATKKGYAIANKGDSINFSRPESKTRRGRVGRGVAQTLDTSCEQSTLTDDYHIRRFTPIECERLQGFPDNWTKYGIINNKKTLISDTQRYKTLGNAVTTNVITYIMNVFFKEESV
ncbi:DNA (cytosine-5-)-methyltransferase [Methanobrevibacter sp. DSM 116169]|uniref:DNA (cytosine-5-)-methyltransferase n=1 Tax=Methanobrevibacter sp. DSM 116169 TaxID=3242727 RepID=UPI0038FD3065